MRTTLVATILLFLLARAGAESRDCLTSCCLYCDGDTFCSFCNNIFRGKEECPCVTEEEKSAFKGKTENENACSLLFVVLIKIIQSRKHLDWQDTVLRCYSKSQQKVLKKMQSFMVKYLEKSPPTKSTSQPPAPPLQVRIHNFHPMRRMMLVMTPTRMLPATCLGTWCWWWRCAGRPAAPGPTAPRPRARSATAACSPRPSCAPASTQVGPSLGSIALLTHYYRQSFSKEICVKEELVEVVIAVSKTNSRRRGQDFLLH